MLPHIQSRAGKAAHILIHLELLVTLFHRVCSPAVQSACTSDIDPGSRNTQISTFCALVRSTIKWILCGTEADLFKSVSKNNIEKLSDVDQRLCDSAEQLTSSADAAAAAALLQSKVFITSLCVPSALRCLDHSIVKISPEHQSKLMQLVVQQAKAVVCQIPLALAHLAVTDALLCRIHVVVSQMELLRANKEFPSLETSALEAAAALAGYVKGAEFRGRGSNDPGAWLRDAQQLVSMFAGFTVRVSLLADLGLQNSECPGTTVWPPYSVFVSGNTSSAGNSALTSPASSRKETAIPSVGGEKQQQQQHHQKHHHGKDADSIHRQQQLTAVAEMSLALPEFGQAFVFEKRSGQRTPPSLDEMDMEGSKNSEAIDSPVQGRRMYSRCDKLFPSQEQPQQNQQSAGAAGHAGVSAADIEKITFDAFRVLRCLVQAKFQGRIAGSHNAASSPSSSASSCTTETFSYEAVKAFLSTDFVLLRPVAMHYKAACSSPSSSPVGATTSAVAEGERGEKPRDSSCEQKAAATAAAAQQMSDQPKSSTAENAPVGKPAAAAPAQKPSSQPQQSGDFLLAMMDD